MDSLLQERWEDLIAIDGLIAVEIELCGRFVRDFPNFAPAWLKYGAALMKVFRLDEAEQSLHRALNLLPRKRRYPECLMGHIFRHRADIATAEQWYRQAIATDPDHTDGYVYLGAMLARVGRLVEAEEIHRRGTECSKGCIDEAFLNLGLVLRGLEQYSAATGCFTEAIRRDPHDQSAKHALRDCRRTQKLFSGKIKRAASANSASAPDNSDNSDWRQIIRMWESFAFRIELCKRYVHAHPDSSPGWTAYGCGLSDLSRFDLAEHALRRAISLSEVTRPMHCEYMGDIFRHRANLATAEEWFRAGIAAHPEDSLAYRALGRMQAQSGRLIEAEDTLQTATRCTTGDINEAFYRLGLVQRALQHYLQSTESFKEAATRNPKHKAACRAQTDCRRAIELLKAEHV